MGQPILDDPTTTVNSPQIGEPIIFLPAHLAQAEEQRPFVAVIRNRAEGVQWLSQAAPGLQWLQIEGLIDDADFWMHVGQSPSPIPLDVVLANPGNEFAALYRLVDARAGRPVRVTVFASSGFFKAVRLAVSLGLPVRILPGLPSPALIAELEQILEFYLHDPLVATPVEFFHSVLASLSGADCGSLWTILEDDPTRFLHLRPNGKATLPRQPESFETDFAPQDFVLRRLEALLASASECSACPWQKICQGYFKWPDPNYSCAGVKTLFSTLQRAATEMRDAWADANERSDGEVSDENRRV